jgi:hypothetical protein
MFYTIGPWSKNFWQGQVPILRGGHLNIRQGCRGLLWTNEITYFEGTLMTKIFLTLTTDQVSRRSGE